MTDEQQYIIEESVFENICGKGETELSLYEKDKIEYIIRYMVYYGEQAMIRNGCDPKIGTLTLGNLKSISKTIDEWISFRLRVREEND